MIKKGDFFEFEIFRIFKSTLSHCVLSKRIDLSDHKTIKKILGEKNCSLVSFKNQLHGKKSVVVKDIKCDESGDALITKLAGTALLIRTADCGGILLYDPKQKVIANIHAGWKGLAKKIIHSTIKKLHDNFGCKLKNIHVAIGPMIGPCCSHFSNPHKELPKFMHKHISEENIVDLWATVENALKECGIPAANIENSRICTFCHPEDFYSYRRGDKPDRFASVIMLK